MRRYGYVLAMYLENYETTTMIQRYLWSVESRHVEREESASRMVE